MTDSRQRQPASDETPHAIPKNAAVLAPPVLSFFFSFLFQPLFHEAAPFAIFKGGESMPSGAEASLTLPLAARLVWLPAAAAARTAESRRSRSRALPAACRCAPALRTRSLSRGACLWREL